MEEKWVAWGGLLSIFKFKKKIRRLVAMEVA